MHFFFSFSDSVRRRSVGSRPAPRWSRIGFALISWMAVLHLMGTLNLNLNRIHHDNSHHSSGIGAVQLVSALEVDTASFQSWPWWLILIFAVLGVLVVVLIFSIIFCCCCGHEERWTSRAPLSQGEMATMVSVDIALVDYLWERFPVGMPSVVDEVQATVRECVVHWRAYEVKTVRERTLVACKTSEQAIHMAIDIQQRLRKKNWDKHLDGFYNEVEQDVVQRRELAPDHASYELDDHQYKALWNGPRVVIGMDSGLVQPEQNWYNKDSYNYVGEVTERACAAEHVAGWGEILLTANTFHQTNLNKIDPIKVECIGKVRLIKDQVSDLMYRVEAIGGRPPYTFEEREALRRCDNPIHEPGSSYYDNRPRKELTPSSAGSRATPPAKEAPPKQRSFAEPLVASEMHADETAEVQSPPPPEEESQPERLVSQELKEQPVVSRRSTVVEPAPITSQDVVYVPVERQPLVEYVPPPQAARRRSTIDDRTSPLTASTYQPTYQPSPAPPTAAVEKPSRKPPGPSPPPPVFWNGKPSVPFQHAYRCFQEGNGLLFRVVDENTGTWSFYNDTIHYTMTATIEIGRKSVFTTLDGAQVPYNNRTKQYEGELVIPPLTTKRLLQGKIKGFNLAYTADAE